jgi:hypothetical protein
MAERSRFLTMGGAMGASASLCEAAGVWAKAVLAKTPKRKAVRTPIIIHPLLP